MACCQRALRAFLRQARRAREPRFGMGILAARNRVPVSRVRFGLSRPACDLNDLDRTPERQVLALGHTAKQACKRGGSGTCSAQSLRQLLGQCRRDIVDLVRRQDGAERPKQRRKCALSG